MNDFLFLDKKTSQVHGEVYGATENNTWLLLSPRILEGLSLIIGTLTVEVITTMVKIAMLKWKFMEWSISRITSTGWFK